MDDIAFDLGVSTERLNKRFPNKNVLLSAIAQNLFAKILAKIETRLAQLDDDARCRDQLFVVINVHIDEVFKQRDVFVLVQNHLRLNTAELRTVMTASNHHYTTLIGGIVKKAQAHGEAAPSINPRLIATIILGTINQWLRDSTYLHFQENTSIRAHLLTNLICNGLAGDGPAVDDDVQALLGRLTQGDSS